MSVSFTSVLVVAAIAFLAPLLLGLLPRAPLPAVVLELVGGALVGPSILGWARWTRPCGHCPCSVSPSCSCSRARDRLRSSSRPSARGGRARVRTLIHRKLEAAGYGVFVPFFFVTAGLQLDIDALGSGSTLVRVPLFVAALLAVRALPAIVYRGIAEPRGVIAAGLLQATTLGFLVVAGRIGMDLGLLSEANGAALLAAGLVSVLFFPSAALSVLRGRMATARMAPAPELQ